jgi:dihydrofolate synthase/folylpolyglutamate synthase
VIGELPQEAETEIAAVARDLGSELIRADRRDADGYAVGLRGHHQRANAAVAVNVLNLLDRHGMSVPPSAVAEGLAHPAWPGRLDLRRLIGGRELLLDAAHNPAGAAALASYLLEWLPGGPRPPLVFGTMRDKDARSMLEILMPAAGAIVATRASTPRAADPVELAAVARAIDPEFAVVVEPAPERAIDAAWRISPRVVVAGSIFLLGDVLKRLDAAW